MQKKQTAIIDFGSSKITALLGDSGVNGTFVIKGRYTFNYDGFAEGAFFDQNKLRRILLSAAEHFFSIAKPDTVYVGVPAAFTRVFTKDSQISFSKKKKITPQDVDNLFDSAFLIPSSNRTLINRSAVVYELDGGRRVANPVGETSETLKGKLSFIVCDNYFINEVRPALLSAGFDKVEFVSVPLAEALYLIEAEVRDRIAVVLDVGYITSSFTIIQGDGIIYQKDIDFGGGYITGAICEQFDIDFDVAEKIKLKMNLARAIEDKMDLIGSDDGALYSYEEVKSTVLRSLDDLCESVSDAFEASGYEVPEYVPLKITGGGIAYLRGAKEHVAGRLNMPVEILCPKVPLSEKPTESSLLSLFDFALAQNNR